VNREFTVLEGIVSLSIKAIQEAEPRDKDYYLQDDNPTGLGVRVWPSGTKTWYYVYRFEGRLRRLKLGKFPDLTLRQARDQAKTYVAVLAQNRDPADQRRGASIRLLAQTYLDQYAKVYKKTWRQDERRLKEKILPRWGDRPAKSIRRDDVEALHRAIGKNYPNEANQTLALLGKMFAVADDWRWMDSSWRNPARGIKKFHEKKRDQWIRPDQMPVLMQSLSQEDNLYVRSGILLYLLTGLRNRELMRTRWSDLDMQSATLLIPDNKASRSFYVRLSDQALQILSDLPRLPCCPWIFPGPDPRHHLREFPRKAWYRIRQRADMSDLRIHDLRRTFGSWLTTDGHALGTVAKALNQSTLATTETYAHLAEDPLREAVQRQGANLAKVIQLKCGDGNGGAILPEKERKESA
jgi:integrase